MPSHGDVNQGLTNLAFFGVGVNLVLFMTKILRQDNAEAANNVSRWTGTAYIFSLAGAFISDSYWGRYKTSVVFQLIFVAGLFMVSLSSYLLLLKPCDGPGDANAQCAAPTSLEIGIFYISIYQIALGNGAFQPSITTLGADQFDEDEPEEGRSKVAFFSYFYMATNLGTLLSNTVLVYIEDKGEWVLGFWVSAGAATVALALLLAGAPWYRHFKAGGNPLARICQVVVAAAKKWRAEVPPDGVDLFEIDGKEAAAITERRRLLRTPGFRFLDRAAVVTPDDASDGSVLEHESPYPPNPWRLCTVTQVEEVKCILRLLPIWLCTIVYSVVDTQMASIFIEQGAAMSTAVAGFHVPPASMSTFEILSVTATVLLYQLCFVPLLCKLRRGGCRSLTELHRMGIGLVLSAMAMVVSGLVESRRLRHTRDRGRGASSLSILWQVPQYVVMGASEVFMYVGLLEFFNGQAPDGLKSFASALYMVSMSLGNYASSLLVTTVMEATTAGDRLGWIPEDLNVGHLDRFYYLLAAMAAADFAVFLACCRWYWRILLKRRNATEEDDGGCP